MSGQFVKPKKSSTTLPFCSCRLKLSSPAVGRVRSIAVSGGSISTPLNGRVSMHAASSSAAENASTARVTLRSDKFLGNLTWCASCNVSLRSGERSKPYVECQPQAFRERIAHYGKHDGQQHSAPLQQSPRRVRPCNYCNRGKYGRKHQLDNYEIEQVGAEKVVRLSPLQKNAAGGASFVQLHSLAEQAASGAVGTA